VRALLSTGQRDRSRLVLTVLSGTLAAATVAGTGIATAAAAQESARSNAVKARHKAEAEAAAARAHHEALLKWAKENPVVVTKARPKKTVIGKPTLVKASSSGSSRVGGGSSSSGGSSGGCACDVSTRTRNQLGTAMMVLFAGLWVRRRRRA
jgi:uncharacterized membrane protein YqiK